VRDERLGLPGQTGGEHDRGAHLLAEQGVGTGKDRRIDDARMREQDLLHVRRQDLATAGVDDVAAAVGQEQVAVVVDIAQVAGAVPAVRDRLGGCLVPTPVAEHQARGAHAHLPDRAGSTRPAVVIDDGDLDPGQRRADGTRSIQELMVEADHRGLGGPVGLVDQAAEALRPAVAGRVRQPDGRRQADAQRAQLLGVGGIEQDAEYRRHRRQHADLLGGDGRGGLCRVEVRQQHQRGTGLEGAVDGGGDRERVRQRQAGEDAVVRAQPQGIDGRLAVEAQRAMGQGDALLLAGGAGGVEDGGRGVRGGVAASNTARRGRLRVDGADLLQTGDGIRRDLRAQLGRGQQQPRAGIGELGIALLRRDVERQRHGDRHPPLDGEPAEHQDPDGSAAAARPDRRARCPGPQAARRHRRRPRPAPGSCRSGRRRPARAYRGTGVERG
jgi:hypothetical protein